MGKSYVGITGFMSSKEVQTVLESVPESSGRLVMIGVLAGLKTLKSLPNKWPNRYPLVPNIPTIFSRHIKAFNLIHYSTDDKSTLPGQLFLLSYLCKEKLHGFQLNMAWPSVTLLGRFKNDFPSKKLVLQVGRRALEEVNNSPEQLAARVAEYAGIAEYMLLDPSGGKGEPFNPNLAREYLIAIKEKGLSLGLGVAGGLSPTTLNLVEPLVKEFPDLNIDAEGRLRTPEDHLDVEVAGRYLLGALKMFENKKSS
ncbi:MAG: hypothetical protein Q8R34_01555 [bacterium]|nr:hypothetical protein [bacterium]